MTSVPSGPRSIRGETLFLDNRRNCLHMYKVVCLNIIDTGVDDR